MADEKTNPDTEAELTDAHAHGKDETGAEAPNQIDQVEINQEKREDPDKTDPRWRASTPIQVIPPDEANREQAEELNKKFEEAKAKAVEDSEHLNPKMGDATQSEKQAEKSE